jgi:hypothetical protein
MNKKMSFKKLIKARKNQICDFMDEKTDPFKDIKFDDASEQQKDLILQYQVDHNVSISEYKQLNRMLDKYKRMKKDLKDRLDYSSFNENFL